MGPTLKSLLMLLATSALCYGERKSEKRDISDFGFGNGYSTSKLEGSGIKISTDFGKEITLEEYKQNGYTFRNDGSNNDFAKDNNGNYDFTKDIENEQQVLANNGIPNTNIQNVGYQGGYQNLNQVLNENQIAMLNAALRNQGNNGDSSSVQYITQNIPVPVPQPYQITINRPVPVPVPQPLQINIPRPVEVPVPQPYPVEITKPYPVYVNRPVPVNIPHPIPVPQRQEIQIPIPQPYPAHIAQQYPVSSTMTVSSDNDNNQDTSALEEQSFGDDKNSENSNQIQNQESQIQALQSQNSKQVVSHESETTSNKGFVPSSFQKGPGLFAPNQNNRQKIPTQEEIFQNLQNIHNQAIQAGQVHNQAVLSDLAEHQAGIISSISQNLKSIGQQDLPKNNQGFNFPAFNYQQVSQSPESFSAFGRQGYPMNLQQNLYQNPNIGHFGTNVPQNAQIQQQYPTSGQKAQSAMQSAAQTQAGEYYVQGVQPQNIQQILSHSPNHASAQNAKM